MRRPIVVRLLIIACGMAAIAGTLGPDSRLDMALGVAVHAAFVAGSTAGHLFSSAADATIGFFAGLPAFVAAGYDHAPEMIIGLGTALSFPFVALGSFVIRWALRRRGDRIREVRASRTGPALQQCLPSKAKAWLEVSGAAGSRDHDISGEMLRIGRDADNELALTDSGVQHFHALIRRTPESEFIVVDMTGIGGSGVAVNGQRLRSSPLKDGDRIELGHAAMTFHRAPRRVAVRPPGE